MPVNLTSEERKGNVNAQVQSHLPEPLSFRLPDSLSPLLHPRHCLYYSSLSDMHADTETC